MTLLLLVLLAQARAPEILERHCVKCHNPKIHKADLDLTTRDALAKKPEKAALLLRSVAHEEEPFMPSKAPKLAASDLAELRAWVAGGYPYPRALHAEAELPWSFAPLTKGSLEALDQGTPIEKRLLLRRLAFDLTGLPPTDLAEDYEQAVERQLASPQYGERWARHWLDVARYADSSGYESDVDRKTAWPYRDAVIRALNEDLPFDQFLKWQLAGDQLAPENPVALALTGFLTCGPASDTTPTDSRRNKEKYRMDELDDVVSTTSAAFLGLTMGCARCHDHKFDPIKSREYYQFVAAFISTKRQETSLSNDRRLLDAFVEPRRAAEREARIRALEIPEEHREILRQPLSVNNGLSSSLYKKHGEAIKPSDDQLRAAMSDDERATWERLAAAAKGDGAKALTIAEGDPVKAWLLGRGDVDEKLEEVRPGFIGLLSSPRERDPRPRVALGDWMTDVEKGAGRLTARVIVNRLWQHHFGEGLVGTAGDFGSQGDRPSDAAFLDGLASELIAGGWRLKPLQRRILLSARFRSVRKPQRLEAEALRDAILSVSGRLNPAMYGPAVKVRIPGEAIVTRSKDDYPRNIKEGPETWRRSIYVFVKRSVLVPFLDVNDAPSAAASCSRRSRTTIAPQALALLNDPLVRDCARAFAARAKDPETAFRMALGRDPRPAELQAASRLELADLCHVLFTLNEFVYVD